MYKNMRKPSKNKKSSLLQDFWRRFRRNKMALMGLVILAFIILAAIFAPLIAPYDYAKQVYGERFVSPNYRHLFGTDNFGRDILSRVIYGARYTLFVSVVCSVSAMFLGSSMGLIAAYFPRWDNLIMRFIDILMGLPVVMFCMSVIAALGSNMKNMMIAITLASIAAFARIMRAQVLTIKEKEFVEATLSIGANDLRIMLRHILPNAFAPILVQFTLTMVMNILNSAAMSFIGMGIQPPTPEWGLMISAGRAYIRDYWFICIIPGLAIVVTTLALNTIGDALRDALDPRLR